MTIDDTLPQHEPEHEESATAHLLQEMTLYGYRPYSDEPDDRPLPEARAASGAVADMFDAMVSTFQDTRLEPDLEDLLWAITNVFHRAGERIERELDDNEQAQRRSQREQDGSEVQSVELERLLREGATMIERRDAMEFFRDACAEQFGLHMRKVWMPRSGSKVNRKALTSAVIDSRDFMNTRRWTDGQVLMPPGTRIALCSGPKYDDVTAIWSALDKILAKYPDMLLLHGGTQTGGEMIGARWAEHRGVTAVAFKPDWKRYPPPSKQAPFKRNDAMLAAMPKGVLVFPGTGIQDNFRDKAVALGLKVWDFRKGGGA